MASEAEETTMQRTAPRRRQRRGPNLEERAVKDLWREGERRWRWPRRGREGGLGGRRRRWEEEEEDLVVFDIWNKYWRRRVDKKQRMM